MTPLKNFSAVRWLPLLFTVVALFVTSTSNATITVTSISGVSKAGPIVAGNTAVNIYAGLAGTCTSGSATCDSCAAAATIADLGTSTTTGCNNNRVNGSTMISITYSSSTAGFPSLYTSQSGTAQVITPESTSSTTGLSYAAGTSITLNFTWEDLCNVAGCDVSGAAGAAITTGTFTFGVATASGATVASDPYTVTYKIIPSIVATYPIANSTCSTATNGIVCNYIAYPGDSKVSLTSLDAGAPQNFSYPTLDTNQPAGALRLYYQATAATSVTGVSETDFGQITPNSGYAELPVDTSGNIVGNGRITGLTNDTVYVFKLAHVDEAGNVGLFTANDGVSDLTCADGTTTCHVSQPGAVEGVLSKTLNCFVATASYGSPFAPKVQTFRDFRNRYLLKNKLGLKFVEFYYSGFGPRAAHFIARSETLRAMSRTALFPVWCFATLSLDVGFTGALLLTFGFFALIALTVRVCSRHLRADA